MIRGSHAQVMKPVHVPSSRPQIPCFFFFFLEHRMHASLDLKESIMSVSQNQKKKKTHNVSVQGRRKIIILSIE